MLHVSPQRVGDFVVVGLGIQQLTMPNSPKRGEIVCIGCNQCFTTKPGLYQHWERSPVLTSKYKKETLEPEDLRNNGRCLPYLKRRQGHSRRYAGQGQRTSTWLRILRRPAGSSVVAQQGSSSIPLVFNDIARCEDGIPKDTLDEVRASIMSLSCVQAYVTWETPMQQKKVFRFLALLVYSMHAASVWKLAALQMGEHSLAVAVGKAGMAILDDVVCFKHMYDELRAARLRQKDCCMSVIWKSVNSSESPRGSHKYRHTKACMTKSV